MNTTHTAAPAPTFRLWLMMVLEFVIWGAWLPLIWGYMGASREDGGLGFTGAQIAWVGSAFAIASIVGIFFSSQFADRTFSAEKFMAFSHLVGGLAILGMFWAKDFPLFFALMLVHSLLYVPTISVANSIAFTHMQNAEKEFGLVRMGGTIGWILAAWPLFFLLEGKTGVAATTAKANIFLVAGIASLILAAYSDAKAAAIPQKWIMPVMSIGQVAEIATMAVLGAVLARLGWKTTMILGILGHAARFAVFAFMPQNQLMIIVVQVLHGVCYAFFFATLYIFIDAAFPKDVRSSAQSLFNLLVLGLGDLAAKWLFIPLQERLTADGVTDYRQLFLVPTFMALAAAVLLAIAFWPPGSLTSAAETRDDPETEPQLVA